MKKLALILAVIMCASALIITSCTKDLGGKANEPDNKPQNNENVVTETIKVPSSAEAAEYNAELESLIEQEQEKFDNDKEILLHVNGVPVSATAVRYANLACHSFYANNNDENIDEVIQKEINDFYTLNAAVVTVAAREGAGLTEEQIQTQIVDMVANYKANFGDDYDSVFEMYAYQTPFYFYLSNLYNVLYSNLFDHYTEDPESEFAKEITEKVLEGDLVRAKHILISFPEGEEVTDEIKAETLAKANEVMALIADGADFDELIATYGEDPGMEANPNGYIFGKGEMVLPFEETTYALEVGEISEPVETDFGYHIIQKLAVEEDYEALRANAAFQNEAYNALSEMLKEEAANYEFVYADNYDERVADFVAEYEAMAAAQAAQAEQTEQAEQAE